MPEEKKEKFTFSDKIKNSKPAGSKSFAKSSAKIGRDGKPKATLFERTRRDAPFFIAALVALLLLPFLYKYSGQASSDEQLLTLGNEQTDFDPERYGFDTAMIEDPDGQIAQLAGRDSLSLIKGYGGNQEEDYGRDDMDLDASSSYEGEAQGEYSAEKHSSSEMDVEENTTNIYKRRAGAATRAAFRRTKVGTLNPAGLRRPGGSRLGINNWGGGMKGAAKKVGPAGPRNAPKPVSLQPLRAAGSRSGFGQGGAAAARRSKDNMGKANPIEALRDSYVKPVDPTRVGGLDMFSMGPGGGSGKLGRTINITPGKEPWWWDMMKTRMQKEWEARFNRKWKWINWLDEFLHNILSGIANCLVTGDDKGDMGSFFGSGGGAGGKKAMCCGMDETSFASETEGKYEFTQSGCKSHLKAKYGEVEWKNKCNDPFWIKGSSSNGARVGFFGQRLKCLGIAGGRFKGTASDHISEGHGLACANIENHHYDLDTSRLPREWQKHTYIYVVARNYRPASLPPLSANAKRGYLCAEDDVFSIGGRFSGGVDDVQLPAKRQSAEDPNFYYTNYKNRGDEDSHHSVDTEIIGEQKIIANMYDRDPEAISNACVIWIQNGDTFNYKNFKADTIANFLKMIKKGLYKKAEGDNRSDEAIAADAFAQLDLMFIESFASEHKLAYAKWFETGNNLHEILPMVYWRFYDAFVKHYKSTNKATGSRTNVDNRKPRVFGEDSAMGDRCYFHDSLSISCKDDMETPQVTVTFKQGYKGLSKETVMNLNAVEEAKNNLVVTAKLNSQDGKSLELNMHEPGVVSVQNAGGNSVVYTLNEDRLKIQDKDGNNVPFVGNITWKVYRNATTQDQAHQQAHQNKNGVTATCTVNLSGDGNTRHVEERKCTSPQQSAKCCDELMGNTPHHWDAKRPADSRCVDDTPTPPVEGKITRLAPVLSWVPTSGTVDCRGEASNDANPNEAVFESCPKVSGIVKGQDQHCGSQVPLMMDSEAAAQFVRDVVKAYNKQNPNADKQLSDKFYANRYPTDGEFVDALFIAQKLGITQVPSSAVCELGRDMVRMSKDPHAGDMPVAGNPDDFKGLQRYYRNELGAFLAYIHPTSILYPNKYYGVERAVCDWRFLPEGASCEGRKSTMKMGKAYYFNYYNDSKNGASLRAYLASFDEVKIPQTYPLAELVKGHAQLAHNCPTDNCASNRNQYNKDDYFGLMISDEDVTDDQGKACVAFAKSATMSVAKALEYVQTVCKVGLDAKPYGNQKSNNLGPKRYVAGQTFTKNTTTLSGNDGSTQKQSEGRGRG